MSVMFRLPKIGDAGAIHGRMVRGLLGGALCMAAMIGFALAIVSPASAQAATLEHRYWVGSQVATIDTLTIDLVPWMLRGQWMTGRYVADGPGSWFSSRWSMDLGYALTPMTTTYIGYTELRHEAIAPETWMVGFAGPMVGVRGRLSPSIAYDLTVKPEQRVFLAAAPPAMGWDAAVEVRLSPTLTIGYLTWRWQIAGDRNYCEWSGLTLAVSIP